MGYWQWLKRVLKDAETRLFAKEFLTVMWIIASALFGGLVYCLIEPVVGLELALLITGIIVAVNWFFSISYLFYLISNDC